MDLTAMASVFGSVLNNVMNTANAQANAERSFKHQKELMSIQNQYAVENWQRENAYNTPEEQRKRLEAAGLNPDLIYGNGSTALQAGSIGAPSSPTAPQAQTIPFENPFLAAVEAAKGINEARKAGSESIGQDIENEYSRLTLDARVREVSLANNWTSEQITKVQEETAVLQQQFAEITARLNLYHYQYENTQASTRKIKAETRKIRKEIQWFDASTQAEIKARYSGIELNDEEIAKIKRLLPLMAQQLRLGNVAQTLENQINSEFAETERSLGAFGKAIAIFRSILGNDK